MEVIGDPVVPCPLLCRGGDLRLDQGYTRMPWQNIRPGEHNTLRIQRRRRYKGRVGHCIVRWMAFVRIVSSLWFPKGIERRKEKDSGDVFIYCFLSKSTHFRHVLVYL